MNLADYYPLILTAAGFLAMLAVVVVLRVRSKGDIEIRPSDALVAIIPVFLILVVAGYFDKFSIGPSGVSADLASKAIVKASNTPVISRTAELPFAALNFDEKGSPEEIDRMLANKTEVLAFDLGRGGYVGSAIQRYFDALLVQSFFQYVLFRDQNGTFGFLCQAAPLAGYLRSDVYGGLEKFAGEIRSNAIVDTLSKLPYCAGKDLAVPKSSDKGDVLATMEVRQRDWLPVIDDAKRFAGATDRTRLTASLLVDVVKTLRAKQ